MPHDSFLDEVLIFLVAAVIAAPIFQRLRSSLVLGYLVAGALIGPQILGLVEDSEATRNVAELGVVFLLFTIGLELSIQRLRVIRAQIFGLGSAQVTVTGVVLGSIALLLGATLESAIVIGGGLALSSTAMVLQLLSERGELQLQVGRLSLAVLLLQDLAVVPLLALVPSLAGPESGLAVTVIWSLTKGVIGVVAIFAVGRLVLRPLFRIMAIGRSPELFAATALLVLLGLSWGTAQLGLSMAMGGFVAGLLLAETEYRHQVAADIAPFRGLLLGLFFMTVGLRLDLTFALERIGTVMALAAGLILIKALITGALARASGQATGTSIQLGLVLGQGGEFAFVMFGIAGMLGVMEPATANLLIAAVAITMFFTPLLAVAGKFVAGRAQKPTTESLDTMRAETGDLTDHVVVLGYGRVGQAVAKTLSAAEIPFVAIEYNQQRVAEARAEHLPVYFGNAAQPTVLRAVGADRARAAVVTMDDADAAERAVHLLHHHHPQLHIFVRAQDTAHRRRLEEAGATGIVHETFEMSLQLGCSVLRGMGTADHLIQQIIQEHRAEDYAQLADVLLPAVAAGEAPETQNKKDDGDA